MKRFLVTMCLILGQIVVPAVPAQASPCAGTSGVTIVVDFGSLGGVDTRCAPGDPASGWAALTGAGFAVTPVQRFPGFVCRISGQPAADPCVNTPPETAYWSYWYASRGGSWTYSQQGPAIRNPAPGTVEGWSFGAGDKPRIAPPAPPPPPPPPPTPPPPPRPTTGAAPVATTSAPTSSPSAALPSATRDDSTAPTVFPTDPVPGSPQRTGITGLFVGAGLILALAGLAFLAARRRRA